MEQESAPRDSRGPGGPDPEGARRPGREHDPRGRAGAERKTSFGRNLQDEILERLADRNIPATLYLKNRLSVRGRILLFDPYVILMEPMDGTPPQLIYKSSLVAISGPRSFDDRRGGGRPSRPRGPRPPYPGGEGGHGGEGRRPYPGGHEGPREPRSPGQEPRPGGEYRSGGDFRGGGDFRSGRDFRPPADYRPGPDSRPDTDRPPGPEE